MRTADHPSLLPIPFSMDERGVFSKPFHEKLGVGLDIAELYWTRSAAGSIRGLHFQTPPFAVDKLVWVSSGSIVDVVVDVRRGPGYGAVRSFTLDSATGNAVFVPAGFAHGFQALEDDSIVNYAVDKGYAPDNDTGVLWSSIDFDWPLPPAAISVRDTGFVTLADFDSPFEAR